MDSSDWFYLEWIPVIGSVWNGFDRLVLAGTNASGLLCMEWIPVIGSIWNGSQ